MKKLISVLLCLLLLAATPLSALAAQGDIIVGRSEDGMLKYGISTSVAAGDALYMMFYEGDKTTNIGVHRVGETEMTLYPIEIGEPITDEDTYAQYKLLADGDVPLVLRQVSCYKEGKESTKVELYEISLEGGIAIATLRCEPDWDVFRSPEGYYNYVESITPAGGYAMMRSYSDNGDMVCYCMNLADGKIALTELSLVEGMAAYVDGKVLVEQYTNEERNCIRFLSYDPATGATETLSEVEVEQYNSFNGLACDLETGKVYFAQDGELHLIDVTTGEIGEAVTDIPLQIYTDNTCGVLDGGFYACAAYDAYAMRNLNPTEKAAMRLKIYDGSYMDAVNSTYYKFVNSHGDTSVILSRDYTNMEGLIDNMMNRESDVDVYILNASSSEYEAIFNRGYIAEFSDSQKLQELAAKIHPSLLERLSVNGQFCALPVEFYFWLPYVDEKALEKIGVSIDEVPTNWSDFIDFLIQLQDRMPEDGSVRLFDPWTSVTSARQSFFEQIFSSYQRLLSIDANAFSAQQMTEILKKLEQVDFAKLGQPTEEESSSENYNPPYLEHGYILSLNMGMSIAGIRQNYYPLVMGMSADTPRILSTSSQVAFINPFSENRAQALEFIEALAENLDDEVSYVLYQDKTEPIPNKYYEEGLKSMQEYVDSLKQRLAEAEEIDKQDLEEELSRAEEELAGYDRYRYSISESDIAWLQENAQYLSIMGPDWLYSDDSGEAYDLVRQYAEGKINVEKLMGEIDRKVRMRMMEGY